MTSRNNKKKEIISSSESESSDSDNETQVFKNESTMNKAFGQLLETLVREEVKGGYFPSFEDD